MFFVLIVALVGYVCYLIGYSDAELQHKEDALVKKWNNIYDRLGK